MQVARIVVHISQRVVDLVVQSHLVVADVLERHPAPFPERHRPVAVESASGVYADSQGRYLAELPPTAGEEVPDRAFHRRVLLIVPVDSKDAKTNEAFEDHFKGLGMKNPYYPGTAATEMVPGKGCYEGCISIDGHNTVFAVNMHYLDSDGTRQSVPQWVRYLHQISG